MMGSEGLKKASQVAILNANYVAHKLKDTFPILYKGKNGNVAHECIIDIRKIKSEIGITRRYCKKINRFWFSCSNYVMASSRYDDDRTYRE